MIPTLYVTQIVALAIGIAMLFRVRRALAPTWAWRGLVGAMVLLIGHHADATLVFFDYDVTPPLIDAAILTVMTLVLVVSTWRIYHYQQEREALIKQMEHDLSEVYGQTDPISRDPFSVQ